MRAIHEVERLIATGQLLDVADKQREACLLKGFKPVAGPIQEQIRLMSREGKWMST
jgi:hypothetical protein